MGGAVVDGRGARAAVWGEGASDGAGAQLRDGAREHAVRSPLNKNMYAATIKALLSPEKGFELSASAQLCSTCIPLGGRAVSGVSLVETQLVRLSLVGP